MCCNLYLKTHLILCVTPGLEIKTYPACCFKEFIIKRVIINLHSNDSSRSFLVSFANHNCMCSCNGCRFLSDIEWNRVYKGLWINLVVINCSFVPGFIRCLVVDIRKVAKKVLSKITYLYLKNTCFHSMICGTGFL